MKRIALRFSLVALLVWPVCHGYAEDIRDVKPPVDFPPNYFLLFLLLAVLLIGGLVFLFLYVSKRIKRNKIFATVTLPPWETAYQRLERLKEKDCPSRGMFKEYYSGLSDIIRRYIEDRFALRAPEMTTEEFLFSVKGSSQINAPQKELLKDFLNGCDMVKFAKYGPTQDEVAKVFSFVKAFIDETKEASSIASGENK